jgi:eukaryotic-like serine/threonine-protein kinase
MASENHCPSCGRLFPRDSRAQVCPACEFAGALTASAAEARDASACGSGLSRLGDYELLEEIAQGGMGVVYRARQVSLNRMVAVKMILPGQGTSPQFLQRFRTEAGAAAKLQHSNIVAIHEIGEDDHRHFFSMEYVEGPNLLDLVRQKPLAPKRAAGYVQQLANAIHYAHQQGVLHRDLKPSNVLISPSDQPKITDFGLAKVLTSDTELTLSGQVLGTPHYLPPEQAKGKRGQVGPWSDVYGLGAILYYLLASRPPFQAQEVTEVLDQVLHREPISPRLLNPSVPRDLETICLKCLEKEARRRYASAQELAEDLGRSLRDETILARPVTAPERAWRWCRRKPALAGALTACTLTVIVGLLGISWQWRRAEREAQAARRNLYDADMLLAEQALQENNCGRVEQLLRKHNPPESARPDEDLRGWEWRYLWEQIRSDELGTLGSHSNTVNFLTFSPDGRWLASASHYEFANDARVWDLAKQCCVARLPLERAQRVNILAFSPDSQNLAVADLNRLQFYRAPDWREPVPGMTISNRFQAVVYSNDGRLLVGQEGNTPYHVTVMDPGDHRVIASWPAVNGRSIVLSPDARYAAVQPRGAPEVIVYELATGAKVTTLPGPGPFYRQGNLLFAPDGHMLASVIGPGSSEWERSVQFWSVPGFKLIQRLQPAESHFTGVAFSPDSRRAYLASADQTISIYDLATWARMKVLRGHRDEVWCVAASRDGRYLASGSRDQTIRLWPTTVQAESQTHWSLPKNTREVYLAQDGQTLAAISTNDVLQVYTPTNFQRLAGFSVPFTNRLRFPHSQWTDVALAPGAKRLALGGAPQPDTAGGGVPLAAFEIPSLRQTAAYSGLRTRVAGLAFSLDGRQLAATGTFDEGRAFVWETESGRLLHTLTDIPARSGYLRFSPGQAWIAIRLDEGWTWGLAVGLWKLPKTTPERVLSKPRHRILDLAFSPDDRYLATAGEDASICIWDVVTGARVSDLAGQLSLFSVVAWAPRGNRLAGGADDGTITIWDTVSHQQVSRLKGHQTQIRGLAFSGDGAVLVSVSMDTLRLWRAPSRASEPR